MLHHLQQQHYGGLQHLTMQLHPLLRFQKQPPSPKIPHLQTEFVTSQQVAQAPMCVARPDVPESAASAVALTTPPLQALA